MNQQTCIICEQALNKPPEGEGPLDQKITYYCPICHAFKVTDEFEMHFPRDEYKNDIWKIQGALREIRRKKQVTICLFSAQSDFKGTNDYTIDELLESVSIPSTPTEKIDRFLLVYKDATGGAHLRTSPNTDYPVAYAANRDEFMWLLNTAKDFGYLRLLYGDSNGMDFQLSAKAWERIHYLEHGQIDSKKVFVACWFDDGHDDCRKTIENAIEATGYEPMSIKERHYPETIISKALGEIQQSRLVVVDLTEQRHTVFVEWGYALGKGIPCLLVVSKKYWDMVHDSEADQAEKLEFYAKNYSIKIYKNEEHLREIISTGVQEILGSKP